MAPVVERRKKIQFAKGNVYEGTPFSGIRWVEPKLDGLRGAVIMENNRGSAVTLTGMNIPNARIIIEEIEQSRQFAGMVIDGEFMASNWNESQSIVKSQKPHPDIENLHFNVFDLLTLEEWETKKCVAPLHVRKANLTKLLSKCGLWGLPHVHVVLHKEVGTAAEAKFLRDQHVKAGYEGIMLKDPTKPYAFKKNNDWMKYKPINEDDFEITGATEGRGKNAKMLGALAITALIKGVKVVSEVGTGFDDQTRRELWADFLNGKLLGRMVQVEFQEVTEDNALRFPSFMRMRDDKQ